MKPAVLLALVAVVIPAGGVLVGCGDNKSVSSSDRAALDSFTDGVRKWQLQGGDPWNRAFKEGGAALATEGPKAELALTKASQQITAASNRISEPEVRAPLQQLAKTCAAKTATIKKIDANTGSLAAIGAGLGELKADGAATKRAWDAWVAAAKKKWDANPLAGLKIC